MEILSVGVDVGTTTTQLILSRLTIQNEASAFTAPRIRIVDKQIIYRSRVHFTPFLNETTLDGDALLALIGRELAAAGADPAQISTGAVIITGEAARKDNAELVLNKLSGMAGQFVVSTAGPDLEAILAGKGSGACAWSQQHDCWTVNADIGGGTANIVGFHRGVAKAYCCLDIGGRQVRVDAAGRLAYVSPSAAKIGDSLGLTLQVGEAADAAALLALCQRMAELLCCQILGPEEPLLAAVRTKGSSQWQRPPQVDAVFLSGGVADCVFAEPVGDFPYGDIGALLGRALRESRLFREADVRHSRETLRATVVGAGVHLVSISGSTVSFSLGLLPLRDLPTLKLDAAEVERLLGGEWQFLAERLQWFCQSAGSDRAAVAFTGLARPAYRQISALAASLAQVYQSPGLEGSLPIVVLETDMAKALGQALRLRLGPERQLLCIDGVAVNEGDYLDLGQPIMHGLVVPVVVKTLIMG